ncbi:macrophage migration inhibitory factor [Eimeria tenella]|uniref:L-dopachrome isomerase n=1 Tax=Eimeria tenella TaxID=5802 RepID=A1XBB4_EIMTE|nr:macrophage migration inhibitory factor [Eimeria tenella]ABC73371.1 macrophage migration inhibitory factor [Eimeria tenella]CDJ41422.1 macrophage migration inhibitory factor [Eimeria tenella]|eukprot:XP_013232172.1 macrophage migration inhibitory factor [Eimeria tenella]
MPLCQIVCNTQVESGAEEAFLAAVESGLSKILGKPTQYITVTLTRGSVRHSGSCDPAASVSVHSIGGISSRTNNMICAEVAALCQQHLKVPVDRVFFHFADVSAANIGIGSRVFG